MVIPPVVEISPSFDTASPTVGPRGVFITNSQAVGFPGPILGNSLKYCDKWQSGWPITGGPWSHPPIEVPGHLDKLDLERV